jgi:ribonuclease P protein component
VNRRHRLRGRAAFRGVRSLRASSSTESLRVAVAPNERGVARIGFAVPRAVGGAVVRNRVRRRLRETLRPRLGELEGLDVVVSVRPGAERLGWERLSDELARCATSARRRLASTRSPAGTRA